MRPVRIELEGFSAYRTREVVDLSRLADTETAFFSLTGATGAGKSSLIDAMIFALYGRIPRLGAREVAPVITAGADRSRVRLDFEASGRVYTAVREVRRTKAGGATVKEARLQIGEKVISDGAANVTEAVEALLGLGFEDFTRTVVLPQGDFARFLHATPSERQNLLRGLLGLDVYARVRTLAGERRAAAQARADTARARLDASEEPTPEELATLRRRFLSLEGLEEQAAAWEDELLGLEKELADAATQVERLGDAAERLRSLEPPPRLAELSDLVSRAVSDLHEAEDVHTETLSALRALEKESAELPDPAVLAGWRRALEEQEAVAARIGELDLESARSALDEAMSALSTAEAEAVAARARLDESKMSHAAHTMASALVAGEPCPVCRRKVGSVPALDPPEEAAGLEAGLSEAEMRVAAARSAANEARDHTTRLEADRAGLLARLGELDSELAGAPDQVELARAEAVVADTKAKLAAARENEESARAALDTARKAQEDLMADQRALGRRLREAQQYVADLKPPITESDDIGVQWKELLIWRDETLAEISERAVSARDVAVAAGDAAGDLRARIAEGLATHGIDVSGSFRASLATETERARQAVARAEQTAEEVATLATDEESARREAAVAKALADHLRADGFEKWMMSGALRNLVVGANGLLAELSDGGYSLHSAEGSFAVIDHRNADELRPVSTLSGGETFLVSLALAMSLAETHAAHGDARLEAVILDEGFGTLDEETLDTVASLLEELAATRGLMVGVITHVKELAERASVRFEVVRGPRGAEVRELA